MALFLENNEKEFQNTIKRCCYIIVNNWETNRKYKYIQELVNLFATDKLKIGTSNSPDNKYLQKLARKFYQQQRLPRTKIICY